MTQHIPYCYNMKQSPTYNVKREPISYCYDMKKPPKYNFQNYHLTSNVNYITLYSCKLPVKNSGNFV